jgi:NAD(P)-dependent dehydrogenase (short-subunit alcohol dehydrogenase family)
MKNKNIVIFGGMSDLSQKTIPYLNADDIIALSSKDCDVRLLKDIEKNLVENNVAIFFSVVNYDNLIGNITEEELNHQIDVNIKGYTNLLRAAANVWKDTGGSIIYVSSILSAHPIKGTAIYSASKSYGDTITKVFAMENAKNKITCNSIQLGYFDGGLTYKVPTNILEKVKLNIPSKRFGNCDELGDLINHIINNRYLTGSNIKLAGGL